MSGNQQARQDSAQSAQQKRQNSAQGAQENRQNAYDEQWDSYHRPYYGGAAAAGAVGAAAGYAAGRTTRYAAPAPAAPVSSLPCTPTVVPVGGANYYRCGSSWYNEAYTGSGVAYVVVAPPAGY
jgi:predicted phage gp36 major capsid-like protein